ncbi:SET and MYND domain-containing protein 3 [Podila verticillata]|nr:SET and MYND domain-containing protein 3 [Podila verticillata]
MLPPQDSHGDTQAQGSSSFTKGGIKAKRNYRTKARDMDSDSDTAPEPTLSNNTATITTSTKKTSLPYVESQNAQNLGEVYPGLARLSFLDQAEQEIDEQQQQQQHELLQKIPRAQSDQPHFTPPQRSHDSLAQEGSTSDAQNRVVQPATSSPVPTLTPPSVLFAGSPTSLVEIRDTGSATKGRGLFSAARETLKPGTLLFKELGYCQVVNDASLSQVCSACFKDTREEQGEDDKAASGLPNGGQRKLVRCAGCKVVWYCNKTCQIKDWKLHHQLECQGIQKSMANAATKDVWTKETLDSTPVRAICRLVRRRERVRASARYKIEHGKVDPQQKQVNEVYVSGLDQREEEWLDSHGADWIEQYLNTYEHASEITSSSSAKGVLDESSQLAKTMAVVMSCVVSPKENRQSFLKGSGADEISSGSSGFDLIRKLNAYGFSMTNLETTTVVALGLYIQSMAFMNHSCVPNCVYIFKGPKVECRVIRDIQPGEEMTISYIDQIGTTKERQRQLKEQYHFVCECPLCRYFPANPLIPVKDDTLKDISDELLKSNMDPKQGFVCSNTACGSRTILATEAQLSVYNKIQAQCTECNHTTELDQELVQENQEDANRLLEGFVREMHKGSSSTAKKSARNFELAKASASSEAQDQEAKKAAVGGMKSVQEPSAQALRYFKEAYRTLTGLVPRLDSRMDGEALSSSKTEEDTSVRRSVLHHAVRQLEQTGFDEAVSQKNWVFALQRSIELESILKQVYVGHHPLKSVQSYYTCKIVNLLANLLLEESTIEIEDSEDDKNSDDEDIEDGPINSDDERDLKALRAAMGVDSGLMQDQLTRRKRRETESEDDKELKKKTKLEVKQDRKRVQEQSSSELLQYLKSLVPKIEDSQILQEFRVCWGKDGKLASRYRYQVDSLKTALHYAEQPFVQE